MNTPFRPLPVLARCSDLLLWLLLAAFTVVWSRYSQLDLQISQHFYDPAIAAFPLRNDPFWSGAHALTRNLGTLLWLLLFAFTLREIRQHGSTDRIQAGSFILLASAVALSVNGFLKTHSVHSCPWNLTVFGGHADYFRLLDALPAHPGNGGCLPSGHAAVGFMWWPLVYACARWRPRFTSLAFLIVLAFGAFCGYLQVVRGAHLVSHVLLAASVTGLCTSALFHACTRHRFWQPTSATSNAPGLS